MRRTIAEGDQEDPPPEFGRFVLGEQRICQAPRQTDVEQPAIYSPTSVICVLSHVTMTPAFSIGDVPPWSRPAQKEAPAAGPSPVLGQDTSGTANDTSVEV